MLKYISIKYKIVQPVLALVIVAVCMACSKKAIEKCDDANGLYLHASYPIGTAVDINALNNIIPYKAIAIKQFNSITPENIFKASFLHPQKDVFHWADADKLAVFCGDHSKRLHGHTLIWHQQLPQWILDFDGDREAWDMLMKHHIETIVAHFRGKVKAWDVVNEAFNEDGTLRNSIWRQKIGDMYIAKAFKYAHEADPDALLFYNDYNLESNPEKRRAVFDQMNSLRRSGINVDGIGLQMHIDIDKPELSDIADAMKQVADQDYKLHISEMDVSVNPRNRDISGKLDDLLNEQAAILSAVVQNYNNIPAKFQYGITFWGISDENSWIRSYYGRIDYPLLYDDNYSPKPAYCKLLETL